MGVCNEQPMCLVDEKWRNAKHGVKITSKQTSSATTHFSTQQKVKRTRTAVAEEK